MPLEIKSFFFRNTNLACAVSDRSVLVSGQPRGGTPTHIDPSKRLRVVFDLEFDKPIHSGGALTEVHWVLANPVIEEVPAPVPATAAVPVPAPAAQAVAEAPPAEAPAAPPANAEPAAA